MSGFVLYAKQNFIAFVLYIKQKKLFLSRE